MPKNEKIALRDLLARFTAESAQELARKLDDGRIECLACGHLCKISEGHVGICRVRYVEGGSLRRPSGYVAGAACDPVEKKPFFHVFPGRDALTFGMLGCNLHCSYCQNWISSQALRDNRAVSPPESTLPERLVQAAIQLGARLMVSSYNEPLITADWALEVFRGAKEYGLHCGFVSNGNATPQVLEFLRTFTDFYKVDLKSFQEKAYRKLGCHLENVLETIRRLKELEYWIEIVTLVVPGFNDSRDELQQVADFIAGVDPDIPWHVTAFHPDYKMMDRRRTPVETLLEAHDIGKAAGLRYVYHGNIPAVAGKRESTQCHSCGRLLISRSGFLVRENHMRGAHCPDCGQRIPGMWEDTPPPSSAVRGYPRPLFLE